MTCMEAVKPVLATEAVEAAGFADMPGAIHESVKTLRSERIIKLYTQQKIEYYKKFSGRKCTMLTEKVRDGMTTGYNEYYVPVVIEEKPGRNRFIEIITEPDKSGLRLTGKPV